MSAGGARVRADIVEVFVLRRSGTADPCRFLQLQRATEPMRGTWQPVIGHAEAGETSIKAARRELEEETGFRAGDALVALQEVWGYYVPSIDAVVLSPRFVCVVPEAWEPVLNHEHASWRWVDDPGAFHWPGQVYAARAALLTLG